MRRDPKTQTRPSLVRTLVPMLCLITLFGAITAIHAFVLTGSSWINNAHSFRVNPNFPPGSAGSAQQQIDAFRCSAIAWRQQAQASLQASYQGTTSVTTVNPSDGVNACYFSPTNPGGGTLAVTVFFSSGPNLVAYAMAFYQANDLCSILWNGVGDPSPIQSDLISVATHEFGHAIGLGHPPVPAATMFASYQDGTAFVRTLHSDDIAGCQTLYGSNGAINADPQINDVDPPDGPTSGGNAVTITGENFTWEADTTVRIDNVVLSSAFWNLDNCGQLVITSMPSHAPGPVPIRIDNELGTVTLNDAYNYGGLPPVLSTVNPASGPVVGGNQVSILGDNLASNAAVFFGAQQATGVTQVSANELLVTVPGAATPGPVVVSVSQTAGSDSLINGYLYSSNQVRIESNIASIGAVGFESLTLATTDVPLAGYSFAVEFDGTWLDVAEITDQGTATEGAEFFEPGIVDTESALGSSWRVGVVMSFTGAATIPVGNEFPLLSTLYDIEPFTPDGTMTVLDIVDGAGSPPTQLVFVPPSGISIVPTHIDALLTLVVGGFLRGDSNRDGSVDVADPVYTLAFLFSGGPGICPDAMDANDDGDVDIGDTIYCLSFLFSGGLAPPPPHPNEGQDPTADSIGC